ncbi:MAG: DNA polymerase III subunit epsilon [Alphaproteobacteria bacterium]|tara:strand:- start:83 stop:757 length:675 start_codon:yes stop_codon:yes gene_type:complete
METEIRQIVLDTETSGLDYEKDRIIEVGCLELIDGIFSGTKFHRFYKPDNVIISAEAESIHGLNNAFLSKFPSFEEDIDDFNKFVDNSELIIHNAQFDLTMINNSLKRASKALIKKEFVICTLEIAKKKYPGSKNNLNALCRRFDISLESRNKHGALTDSFLLLDVYNELMGGKQHSLNLTYDVNSEAKDIRKFVSNELVKVRVSDQEKKAHLHMLNSMKKNIW